MSTVLSKLYPTINIDENDLHNNVDQLRDLRDQFNELMLIDTATFFTDKLLTLTSDDKNEVYNMAKLLYEKEEFQRAAFFITSRNLHQNDLSCRYLAAKCYFDSKDYEKSLEILSIVDRDSFAFDSKHGTLNEWKSSIELLKGYVYEEMDDRDMAKKCFLQAIRHNIYCYEAFHGFIKFNMFTKDDEKTLLDILKFDKKMFTVNGDHFIKYFYLCELNKSGKYNELIQEVPEFYKSSSNFEDLEILSNITSSIDVQLNNAEKLYNDCKFMQCYQLISHVNSKDQFNPRCLLLTIACLLELNKNIELQELAHKLVEINPEKAIAWYAVGCYYYMISNADFARKYFSKSVSVDKTFQPSMLMFAHSFELDSLHDQAMAVYLELTKTMPTSFLPLLYVGVEYSHINNPIMAERYINEALELSKNDLFVLHELAIIYYQKKEYQNALDHFLKVHNILLSKNLMTNFSIKWEPLLNNMGHVCRKLKQYDNAIKYHNLALKMVSGNASTYDSIGLAYSLKGDLQMACDYFKKALSLKRDDAFAMTMQNIIYKEFNREHDVMSQG